MILDVYFFIAGVIIIHNQKSLFGLSAAICSTKKYFEYCTSLPVLSESVFYFLFYFYVTQFEVKQKEIGKRILIGVATFGVI